MQTESHGIFDNLLFPFWSLRDCIIYSAHRNLDGWAYKRASGISGSWKKRHFRMCQDDESGSNICLEYYIDDDSSTPIRKTINLRTLLSVTFSPETSLPKGKDVPSDLVCFKLVLNDGQRFCLAADHHTAIKWTSIFSWYACAGRIITEWRIQYGDLTKDKISTRDWINAGIVIVNMTSYVSLQEKFKEAIASVLLESSKNKLSDSAKKLALAVTVRKIARTAAKTYVAPRQRLILKLCGISEQNLQNSLQVMY
jgi:hypothetical protein